MWPPVSNGLPCPVWPRRASLCGNRRQLLAWFSFMDPLQSRAAGLLPRSVHCTVQCVQCTVYSTTMPGLSAELGPMNGWSGDLATSILLLCAGSCSKWATWLVREITGTIFTQQFSTVQHTLLWYTVHAFFGSEDNVVWSHLINLILNFHVLVFIMIVLLKVFVWIWRVYVHPNGILHIFDLVCI